MARATRARETTALIVRPASPTSERSAMAASRIARSAVPLRGRPIRRGTAGTGTMRGPVGASSAGASAPPSAARGRAPRTVGEAFRAALPTAGDGELAVWRVVMLTTVSLILILDKVYRN